MPIHINFKKQCIQRRASVDLVTGVCAYIRKIDIEAKLSEKMGLIIDKTAKN